MSVARVCCHAHWKIIFPMRGSFPRENLCNGELTSHFGRD